MKQQNLVRPFFEQFALLLSSFGLAWAVLALFDFGYSYWFDLLNIELFIAELGPQNYHKIGFAGLGKNTYVDLFQAINYSIHLAPQTLATIEYPLKLEEALIMIPLLREPEVIHLQDVAKLISLLKITTVLAFCALIYFAKTKKNLAITKIDARKKLLKQILYTWLFLITLSLSVYFTDPTALFYWLHDAFFPPENQWFFYYQDSLMTTLMKAPFLFGPISLSLLALTLLIQLSTGLLLHQFQFAQSKGYKTRKTSK